MGLKEVKKVKKIDYRKLPYLETKVVKVEKEWDADHCPTCGQRIEEPKGNWVNGEELEALLNNCVDDDEAILLEREIEGLEEAKING